MVVVAWARLGAQRRNRLLERIEATHLKAVAEMLPARADAAEDADVDEHKG
jgi:hypothetical protein